MAEPLLDIRNVGPVFESVSGCSRPERMGAKRLDADADEFRAVHHYVPVHRITGERLLQLSIGSSDGSKQGTLGICAVS